MYSPVQTLQSQRLEELRQALGVGDEIKVPHTTTEMEPVAIEVKVETPAPPRLTVALNYTRAAGRVLKTPIVLGLLTAIVVFTIFMTTKPGIFGCDVVNEKGKCARSANVKACLWAAAIAGVCVIIVPYVVKWKMGE